ncbi:hypothetical protein KUCAC02_012791 [Chaenocephalus aceratus]|uniref:Uncharacterized protein n=1 Tax=Chaenocephalus aceratus TaxID=36190 RepID=A0ACB9XBP5_CHAAC|nr:hypothetical protein KUCAC02_012791 [Chaenocephalus aceratus]
MLEAFLSKYPERRTELEALQVNCQSKDLTAEEWNTTKERADTIQAAFQVYLKERASNLYPIVRDLTNSLHSGDWILYLSAMERATSLFFFFGRTNYCRWTPLFLQDCYQLKDKFPLLYDSYMHGGFVVNTTKKGSGVPFDQALEQCYNRPVKVSGGIIGITRKKEAVALWGIIKHKKDQYADLLKMKDDVEEELSLHHDFNPSTATKMVGMVQDIAEYLLKFTSPKTTLNLAPKVDIKDETIKALMFIEYGCHRGFTVEELLQHEITNSAFFLVDKDGYLRKSAKSQLGTELLKLCPLIDKKGPETSPQTHAIIIDFMALVRKVPLKKLDSPVKTFHDFAIALTSMVTKAGHNCDEIHIVFDTYREDSIKNGERERRGKSKEMVVLDVISPNQNVPVVLENFWSSSISKTAFQAFYVEWLTTNYQGTKPLYLGVRRSILPLHDICLALGDELTKCLPALHALTGVAGIKCCKYCKCKGGDCCKNPITE